MIDLVNKRFTITGLPGSGKTELAKFLLRHTEQHLVYDPMQEYQGYNQYIPTNRNSEEELSTMILKMVIPWKPRLFLVDESNRYIRPKPHPLPEGVEDLNDRSRHYGISWGLVFRKPSQLNTDVSELCHYHFVFSLQGRNDKRWADAYHQGLGKVMADMKPFHFLVLQAHGEYYVHDPIPWPQPVNWEPLND